MQEDMGQYQVFKKWLKSSQFCGQVYVKYGWMQGNVQQLHVNVCFNHVWNKCVI